MTGPTSASATRSRRSPATPPPTSSAPKKRTITSVTHPDDRGPVEREIAAALAANRPFSLEYRIMHADGRTRWVLERGVKTVDCYGVEWLDGIIFDISEPHAAEELRIERELEALHVTELEASRARIVAAGDDTRRRIERDLHDGAQQRLVVAALAMRAAERAAEPDGEVSGLLQEARAELSAGLAELRELARGIHPTVLDRSRARPGRAGARSPLRRAGRGRRHGRRAAAGRGRVGALPRGVGGAHERRPPRRRHARHRLPAARRRVRRGRDRRRRSPAAPTARSGPACATSRTASRRSAACSSSTARRRPAPGCARAYRSDVRPRGRLRSASRGGT